MLTQFYCKSHTMKKRKKELRRENKIKTDQATLKSMTLLEVCVFFSLKPEERHMIDLQVKRANVDKRDDI